MKSIRLRIKATDASVHLSAPYHVSERVLYAFVQEREAWILKQRERAKGLPQAKPIDNSSKARKALLERVQRLAPQWEQHLGVKASSYSVRLMKSRWGSCNIRTKKIALSMMLADRTDTLLEYVLVHELVHLREPGHNRRFYQFMEDAIPNWRALHKELHGE
ncbi:YgjP-like metallopeptidase domain-containing protein [Aliidiomarina indica]|uniref:YgjP-like metallopeptidase domain-containing protein n=1 Tax=Aliidiomarina indica TaxID=2749147 RepID=UPI00188FDC59|nr:YgjP-like metallopeptidase domain-containing protein [Aliidiomarina indica]